MNAFTYRIFNYRFSKFQEFTVYADNTKEAEGQIEWITRGQLGTLIKIVYGVRK